MIAGMNRQASEELPPAEYFDGGFDLHQSQRVLSALADMEEGSTARESGQAAITLAEQLAAAVAQAMSGLTVRMDGRTVGGIVAPTVSEAIARQIAARRYTV